MFDTFRDADLRERMAGDGFMSLPFLEAAAVEQLRKLFDEVRTQVDLRGFASTTTSPDLALKRRMVAEVEPLYQNKLEVLLQDYKSLGVSFLHKDAGAAGDLPLHQDWTVTEETHWRTFTIWIPLHDTTEEEGALQLLPGSHRWMNLLRGPNLPIAIRDVEAELRKGLVTLPLRAGEAVIFDHSVLHTSTRNTSGHPRIAVTYGFTHRDAPLRFWYHHPGDARNRYEQLAVPDDFFLQYPDIGQRPKVGRSLGYYHHDLQPLTAEETAALQAGKPIHRPILRDLSPKEPLLDAPQFPITVSAEWNAALARQGYVAFPLLDAEEVAGLRAFFMTHQPEVPDRFYASVHNPHVDGRMQMDAELQRVVGTCILRVLDAAEPLGGSFIAKPAGSGGILPPHADWNIVDERQWRSYNLWIPLVDTTVENGAVHVVPGSHTWLDSYRGPGIPNPFEPHRETLWKAMQPLELRAGTALLYDHRLLHASPANQTDTVRLACVLGVKPKAAALRYYRGEGGLVREYAANGAFYLAQNPEDGPGELPLLGVVTDRLPEVSEADLRKWLGEEEAGMVREMAAPGRSFWQTYTPGNVWREIKWRLSGKK